MLCKCACFTDNNVPRRAFARGWYAGPDENACREVHDPPSHARPLACIRRSSRKERRVQRLLVHVLADRPTVPQKASRQEQGSFRKLVKRGPPPGLLAFDGDVAVGWCPLAPRDELSWLDHSRLLKRVDDRPVWSLPCFFVRRAYRRRGVTAALIAAASNVARQARAQVPDGYPIDTAAPKSSKNLFTGIASTFARSGFKTVARRAAHRPIVRVYLSRSQSQSLTHESLRLE